MASISFDIINMDRYFEIQHVVHPEHPLTLVDLEDSETRGLIETQKKINWEKQISDRLRQGPLDEKKEEEEELDVSISCVLCRNEMLGTSSYSCTICDIHMHKLCSKLPTELIHPNHTEHPPTLTNHRRFRRDIIMEAKRYEFSYCSRSREKAINHKGHPHPLYPFLRTASFECDACAKEHSPAGVSYMCNTCDFWVHEDCATLPATVKYHGHAHSVSLHFGPYHPSWGECAICDGRIAEKWMYMCDAQCVHTVHVTCLAVSLLAERRITYEVDDEIDLTKLFQLPESFHYDDIVAQMIKHTTIHYEFNNTSSFRKVDGRPLISHFSHKHPLTLICNDDMPSINNNEGDMRKTKEDDVLCNGCVLPILRTTVYYSCTVCNDFVLHEWCAKLPNELQLPTHPHPLILVGPAHKDFGLTVCPACETSSNGFSYKCQHDTAECDFAMDVKCLLPPAISHKAHKHPLKLVKNCAKYGCVACCYGGSHSLAYGCVSCGFYLHHYCALKPVTIVHRYDKHHPFISTSVEPIENQADEYVCEFCEQDINPETWWFHHCLHCDLSACAKCIFPEFGGKSHLNLRLTYSSDSHDHPLSFVKIDRTNWLSRCSKCHWDMLSSSNGYALQCAQCKVMFHDFKCSEESIFPLVQLEGPNYHQ